MFEITGRYTSGLKMARQFTEVDWVRQQLREKADLVIYPGTVNLEVWDPAEQAKVAIIRERRGIELIPPVAEFCTSFCVPVLLAEIIRGVVIFPDVADYPVDKLEIIADRNVRETLDISEGALLRVRVLP